MKEQYRIAAKRSLTPEIGQISVEAPLIAAKAKAGQFIILRVDEAGERIPLTISSAQDGKVTVVYQKVGGSYRCPHPGRSWPPGSGGRYRYPGCGCPHRRWCSCSG